MLKLQGLMVFVSRHASFEHTALNWLAELCHCLYSAQSASEMTLTDS